jgi:hypothetical protein
MFKFSCFIFGNTTNKTVTGMHIRGGLLANHLELIIMIDQSEILTVVRSNLLHSFLEVHICVVPFTSCGKLHEFDAGKQNF